MASHESRSMDTSAAAYASSLREVEAQACSASGSPEAWKADSSWALRPSSQMPESRCSPPLQRVRSRPQKPAPAPTSAAAPTQAATMRQRTQSGRWMSAASRASMEE